MTKFSLMRTLGYMISGIVAILMVASVSERLMHADQAWMYLATGAAVGTIVALIAPLMRLLPEVVQGQPVALFAIIAMVFSFLALVGIRALGHEMTVSWSGAAVGMVVSGGLACLTYCLVDDADG